MTPREVRWERMFPDELEAAFAACPVVYFTYGPCEPHGPQNAVGLDELKAHAIACAAARRHGGIVAPPFFHHMHELASEAGWAHEWIGEVPRTWLTSVPPWHFWKTVLYHVRAADTHGFHGAILHTGHGTTDPDDFALFAEVVQPHVGTRLLALLQGEGLYPGDHAGRIETSLLWAVEPECVDISRVPDAASARWAMGPDAHEADRRWGEQMVAREADVLGEHARALRAAYERERPQHRLLTLADVERVWDEVVVPALPRFRSLQDEWWQPSPPPPPPGSVWRPNSAFPDGVPGRG